MSASLSTSHYSMTGHAVIRFATAHLLDPIAAILRAHEDLAVSRVVSLEEARGFLQAGLRCRDGRTYRVGATGLYVCVGNRVITYLDREKRFRTKWVRGPRQWGRACWGGSGRKMGRRRRR